MLPWGSAKKGGESRGLSYTYGQLLFEAAPVCFSIGQFASGGIELAGKTSRLGFRGSKTGCYVTFGTACRRRVSIGQVWD